MKSIFNQHREQYKRFARVLGLDEDIYQKAIDDRILRGRLTKLVNLENDIFGNSGERLADQQIREWWATRAKYRRYNKTKKDKELKKKIAGGARLRKSRSDWVYLSDLQKQEDEGNIDKEWGIEIPWKKEELQDRQAEKEELPWVFQDPKHENEDEGEDSSGEEYPEEKFEEQEQPQKRAQWDYIDKALRMHGSLEGEFEEESNSPVPTKFVHKFEQKFEEVEEPNEEPTPLADDLDTNDLRHFQPLQMGEITPDILVRYSDKYSDDDSYPVGNSQNNALRYFLNQHQHQQRQQQQQQQNHPPQTGYFNTPGIYQPPTRNIAPTSQQYTIPPWMFTQHQHQHQHQQQHTQLYAQLFAPTQPISTNPLQRPNCAEDIRAYEEAKLRAANQLRQRLLAQNRAAVEQMMRQMMDGNYGAGREEPQRPDERNEFQEW